MAVDNNIMNAGTGLAVGVVGQLAANQTAKSMAAWTAVAANAGKAYPEYKRWDTIVSFGVPVVGLVASMTNIIPISRSWSDKMVLAGSVLAGQRIVQMMTKKDFRLVYAKAAYTRPAAAWTPAPSAYNVLNATDVMV